MPVRRHTLDSAGESLSPKHIDALPVRRHTLARCSVACYLAGVPGLCVPPAVVTLTPIRVAYPSRQSESPIRVAYPSRLSESLSKSPIRVSNPSRQSESPIRVAYPSRLFESPFRVSPRIRRRFPAARSAESIPARLSRQPDPPPHTHTSSPALSVFVTFASLRHSACRSLNQSSQPVAARRLHDFARAPPNMSVLVRARVRVACARACAPAESTTPCAVRAAATATASPSPRPPPPSGPPAPPAAPASLPRLPVPDNGPPPCLSLSRLFLRVIRGPALMPVGAVGWGGLLRISLELPCSF